MRRPLRWIPPSTRGRAGRCDAPGCRSRTSLCCLWQRTRASVSRRRSEGGHLWSNQLRIRLLELPARSFRLKCTPGFVHGELNTLMEPLPPCRAAVEPGATMSRKSFGIRSLQARHIALYVVTSVSRTVDHVGPSPRCSLGWQWFTRQAQWHRSSKWIRRGPNRYRITGSWVRLSEFRRPQRSHLGSSSARDDESSQCRVLRSRKMSK